MKNNRLALLFVLAALSVVLTAISASTATLSSSVQLKVSSTHTSSVGLSTVDDTLGYALNRSWSNGTDTANCDLVYHGTAEIGNGATASIDLAGGIADSFGNTVTFATIKTLMIENTSASMTLIVGGAAANAWEGWTSTAGSVVNIPPRGVLVLCSPDDGFAVTADTGDILDITNPGASSSTYKLWAVGTSE